MSRPNLFLDNLRPVKNFVIYFLIGVVFFSIIANGVSSLFWEDGFKFIKFLVGIQDNNVLAIFSLRLGLVFLLLVILILIINFTPAINWFRKSWQSINSEKLETEANYQDLKEKFEGLIAVMSKVNDPNKKSPAEIVIEEHWSKLRYCWLICTEDSQAAAEDLIARLRSQSIDQALDQGEQPTFFYGDRDEINDINSPDQKISLLVPNTRINDPIYIQQLVDCIYADAEQKGLDESKVIADFTGGTRSMGIGIVLAGVSPRRRLQYISQIDQENKIKEIQINFKIKAQKSIF